MTNETKKFRYTLTYKCKKCGRDSVTCTLESDDAALPDSDINLKIQQATAWCEAPGCGWSGPVAGLQFVRKNLGTWMA